MTALFIILSILSIASILLWLMLLFSNEAVEGINDAYTVLWMSFLFLVLPWMVLTVSFNKLHFLNFEIPYSSVSWVAVAGLIFGSVSGYIASKNYLLKQNEYLKSQKLKISSEQKKRFELIPNLVKVIKSFTENENRNIDKVLENREKTMKYYSENNLKQLDQSLNILLHSAYDYPSLQNQPLYRNLNASLINTQENINYYTSEYNEAVAKFNSELKTFPISLVYKTMKLQPAAYLDDEITEEQKNAENLLKNL